MYKIRPTRLINLLTFSSLFPNFNDTVNHSHLDTYMKTKDYELNYCRPSKHS